MQVQNVPRSFRVPPDLPYSVLRRLPCSLLRCSPSASAGSSCAGARRHDESGNARRHRHRSRHAARCRPGQSVQRDGDRQS